MGIRGLKLFAYGGDKDAEASAATRPDNLMVDAIRAVKDAAPEIVITTEVCGCSWTDHGEWQFSPVVALIYQRLWR